MRVAIIGAGFTGLTAAYELTKAKHQTVVFDKAPFAGGLASGIRRAVNDYPANWWDLERFYHHWFTNHRHILDLFKELGMENKLITKQTITSIWYQEKAYPLDSPLSYLSFPHLPLIDKLRAIFTLGILRLLPSNPIVWKQLEKTTAHNFLKKWMGEKAYETPWRSLLAGKFEHYFDAVNLAWFYSRVKERTKDLMYCEGGYQTLIDALVQKIQSRDGEIRLGVNIGPIMSCPPSEWKVGQEKFSVVIVTAPPEIFIKLVPQLPQDYKDEINQKLQGIGAQDFVLVLNHKLIKDRTYWLNINERSFPFLVVAEHTNFMDSKHYGGKTIVYVGEYLPADHPKMNLDPAQLLSLYLPGLKRINPNFDKSWIEKYWFFREPFAQPIFPVNHSQNIPSLETPLKNLYLASMSQVYPWDRGTNYAVELGKRVAQLIINEFEN